MAQLRLRTYEIRAGFGRGRSEAVEKWVPGLKDTAATELIEPAVVAARAGGSRFQFTVDVDDVDEMCAQLAERGVELLNGPVDRPWGVRTACLSDPDGHIWEIAAEKTGVTPSDSA